MNKRINFLTFKIFAAVLFCCFAVSNVFASSSSAADKSVRALVASNLSARLKTDLAQMDVSVKLSNVAQRAVSKNTIEIKGDGVCLTAAQNGELPIRFEAKINVAQKSVVNISYDFVEASATTSASEYAPTSNEEFLMKELMKQISRDYKTDRITIALDGVEGSRVSIGEKQFTGVGEVRIGDLEWNKINFDVVVDESGRTKKVVYDVKK